MIKNDTIQNIVYGTTNNIGDDILHGVEEHVKTTIANIDRIRLLSTNTRKAPSKNGEFNDDTYFNIAELMSNDNGGGATGIHSILNDIYDKNKRYYSILKDYDLMPTLIPQIFRVLSFLTDECISPDLQTSKNFVINIKSADDDTGALYDQIEEIRREMDLDRLLRSVWDNRFKLGAEYYLLTDYKKTFSAFKQKIEDGRILNESAGSVQRDDISILTESCAPFVRKSERSTGILNESTGKKKTSKKISDSMEEDELIDLLVESINIDIEISSLNESANKLKMETIADRYSGSPFDDFLNEATGDTTKTKYLNILDYLTRKDYTDCSIYRLDPEKIFKLAPGGKTIGYFYIKETEREKNNHAEFLTDTIRDKIRKNRMLSSNKSHIKEEDRAEKKIGYKLAEKMLNTFDPSIGINNIEDIDLFHDFVMHNELDKGNKSVVFYYPSEIVDLSRTEGSLLTNAVFFTKLCSTLMLNNIITKVLRGRGRQIHTVNMGVSASIQRYIENAVSSLSMPETRLGSITGSFKYLLNPVNSASDIVIPSEDGIEKFISTDLIEGQDVDMDMEIIKFLMNSIVMSFGLDSAVIDTTNGNVDFAKTLTMLSKQIANKVLVEQRDLIMRWEKLVLDILKIKGTDELQTAIENNQIEVKFYSPRSLLVSMSIDELNNAKQFAETLADVLPMFQGSGEDIDLQRAVFIYDSVKRDVNIDWDVYEEMSSDSLTTISEKLKNDVMKMMEEYAKSIVEKNMSGSEGEGDDGSSTGEDDDMYGDDL